MDVFWKATHVKFKDLEKAAEHRLKAFDEIRNGVPGVEIALRVPYYDYSKYGIQKAIVKLGLEGKAAIYVNF